MITLREFLLAKRKEVWSVTPATTLEQTLKFMSEKDVGAVPVVENNRIVGIFSERDFARTAAALGHLTMHHAVARYMTTRVHHVSPQTTMEKCMAIMTSCRVRHLPILEKKNILGIITIGDVVKHVIQEQKFILRKVLESIEEGKMALRTNVTFNVEQNILPLVGQLSARNPRDAALFRLLEDQLNGITSEHDQKLVSAKFNFTPAEISVIKLIKAGRREKEIAEALNISISTVKKHKYAIRGKMGIRRSLGHLSLHLQKLD